MKKEKVEVYEQDGVQASNNSDGHQETMAAPLADIESLRLSQDFVRDLAVEKVLTTVPIRKPGPQEFCRTHPDQSHWFATATLEDRETREVFIVSRHLWQELSNEITLVQLVTAVNRQDSLFLWLIKLPKQDGRANPWNQSLAAAADLAKAHWVRVQSNMSIGSYDVHRAVGTLPDPQWPDLSFADILSIALKGHLIDDMNHPVLKKLRGEI